MNELLDIEELSLSLTGFDEIAIERFFRAKFVDLGGTTLARALVFIDRRRSGMSDKDAHQYVMNASIGEIQNMFKDLSAQELDGEGKD